MIGKPHWPFGEGGEDRGGMSSRKGRTRVSDAVEARKRVRFDRLIVGGRAHARKHGLS